MSTIKVNRIENTSTTDGGIDVDSSGRVGVNTATPGGTLDVKAASSTAPLIVQGPSSEFNRIDDSGRLLVGTSTAQGNALLQVLGDSAASTNYSQFTLRRGLGASSYTTAGNYIGEINFQELNGGSFGSIRLETDAACGSNDFPGRLVFSTCGDGQSSPTERMRITQKGGLVFAQGAAGNSFSTPAVNTTKIECDADVGHTLLFNTSFSAGDRDALIWYYNSTRVGSIQQNTTSVKYNTSSDYRLKENVVPVRDGIARLQQLKPCRFSFKIEPGKTVDGFIAHEVQSVVPEAISGAKDAMDKDGDPIYQGIDQSKLVPLLTAALQEAVARIESLEARLTAAGI